MPVINYFFTWHLACNWKDFVAFWLLYLILGAEGYRFQTYAFIITEVNGYLICQKK